MTLAQPEQPTSPWPYRSRSILRRALPAIAPQSAPQIPAHGFPYPRADEALQTSAGRRRFARRAGCPALQPSQRRAKVLSDFLPNALGCRRSGVLTPSPRTTRPLCVRAAARLFQFRLPKGLFRPINWLVQILQHIVNADVMHRQFPEFECCVCPQRAAPLIPVLRVAECFQPCLEALFDSVRERQSATCAVRIALRSSIGSTPR